MEADQLKISQRTAIRNLLATGDAYATTLVVIVMDVYGAEAFTWAPATLRMEIEQDFNIALPQALFDRLMAGVYLVTTDAFFRDEATFVEICNVLSGGTFDPTVFDPADTEEMAWGISEALLLNPPEAEEPFSDAIRKYMGRVLDAEGITTPPDVLRIALRDKDVGFQVRQSYADDPDTMSAIEQAEKAKSDAIMETVRDNLKALESQLSRLQLEHGSAENLLQRLAVS